jgi:hypothetical protein
VSVEIGAETELRRSTDASSRRFRAPDLDSNAGLALMTAITTAIIITGLVWQGDDLRRALGDTDDAMRLVMVRDLLAGRGWWDQLVTRLQPPSGVYMHWSRLVDGGLASMIWLFERVLSPAQAEIATRLVWPQLWIAPAVAAMLAMARSLGGRTAVLAAAVLAVIDDQAFVQFRPGRVDHHNIQITMALAAAAAAMAHTGRGRWATLAGAATGLGLAVGIEALPFQALIGIGYALRGAIEPDEAPVARAYGLSLFAASVMLFAIQTPPWRWLLSTCDALAFNLVAALAVAGLGLATVATWGAGQSLVRRLGATAVVGAAAAAAYVLPDAQCLHGPFAAVDPRLRPFWFDTVQELAPWPRFLRIDHDWAVLSITATLMAVAAAVVLIVRRPRSPETLLALALIVTAAVTAANALRMHDYVYGFGLPVLGAAFAVLADRGWRGRLVLTTVLALALSPTSVGWALGRFSRPPPRPVSMPARPANRPAPSLARCLQSDVYRPLATLPPGVVLGEIDLGPFILAETKDSVMAAPYHRMSYGILAAHEALAASPTAAEAKTRAMNVAYVVECPGTLLRAGPGSLAVALRNSHAPAWLEPLSAPGQVLQIYRVRPQAPHLALPGAPDMKEHG